MTRSGAAMIAFCLLVGSPALSQPLGSGSNGTPDVPLNHIGGVPILFLAVSTLVPGTVVVPGVSGTANTGTVPLPGMNGAEARHRVSGPAAECRERTVSAAYYPAIPSFGTVQSTLPLETGNPNTLIAPPTPDAR